MWEKLWSLITSLFGDGMNVSTSKKQAGTNLKVSNKGIRVNGDLNMTIDNSFHGHNPKGGSKSDE